MTTRQAQSVNFPAATAIAAGSERPAATCYEQSFAVRYAFPVVFTRELFAVDNPVLADTLSRLEQHKRHRIIVFVDAGVVAVQHDLPQAIERYCTHFARQVELVCSPICIEGGEFIKRDWEALAPVRDALEAYRIDRHSFVLAVGGGALLDAVGLVAATAHRGIRHIRVPTTVLAQDDSGVGVKNGINQYAQKNYLGTFAPPFAVLNDSRFIDSLPAREKVAGMAEAVKVALIRDAGFFTWLESHADALSEFDPASLDWLIQRCAQLHMRQIGLGGDPFELGSARPLDFGHWAAHRLETLTAHRLNHGEAVAIGMLLDCRYSVLAGHLDAGDELRVLTLLRRLGLPVWDDALDTRDPDGQRAVLQGLTDFREHLGGELTITLLESLGTGLEVHEMDVHRVDAAIDWMRDQACRQPARFDRVVGA